MSASAASRPEKTEGALSTAFSSSLRGRVARSPKERRRSGEAAKRGRFRKAAVSLWPPLFFPVRTSRAGRRLAPVGTASAGASDEPAFPSVEAFRGQVPGDRPPFERRRPTVFTASGQEC